MKQFSIYVLIVALSIPTIHAQNLCDGHEKPNAGIPKELNRGRLKREGALYGNPYTLMDRKKYPNPNDGFRAIRNNLKNVDNRKLQDVYKSILAEASKSLSSVLAAAESGDFKHAKSIKPSPLAIWAKYNAFVFVIGLDSNFNELAATSAKRLQYQTNALEAFRNMNCRVYGKDLKSILTKSPVLQYLVMPTAFLHDWLDVNERLQGRALELIMYCEAYDWLKAAAQEDSLAAANVAALPPYDWDRNGSKCLPRDNLRLFARNFFIAADGWFGTIESPRSWKKSRGIIAASAIGTAAIVLNDAGVEANVVKALFSWVRPAPNYSPNNWHKLGEKCWENLLEGKHVWPWKDVPQTNGDGTAGYAEGPGFFNYAMGAMLPYARTYENWLGHNNDQNNIIYNMQKWQENISLSNGSMPTYDDTDVNDGSVGGLYGKFDIVFKKYYKGDGLEVDFVALLSNTREIIKPDELSVLAGSGNATFRSTDGDGSKHYCQFLFEPKQAYDYRGDINEQIYHEHDDYGSFMVAADDEWLIIDPAFIGTYHTKFIGMAGYHNIAMAKANTGVAIGIAKTGALRSTRKNGMTLEMTLEKGKVLSGETQRSDSKIERSIDLFNTKGRVYYMVYDKLNLDNSSGLFTDNELDLFEGIKMFVNGNGSNQAGETSFIQTDAPNSTIPSATGRIFKWYHPCSSSRNTWGVMAQAAGMARGGSLGVSSVFGDRDANVGFQDLTFHGSGNDIITNKRDDQAFEVEEIDLLPIFGEENKSEPLGTHCRMQVTQATEKTVLQTLILPYKCSFPNYPNITRVEDLDYVSTTIGFLSPNDTVIQYFGRAKRPSATVLDSVRDFHLSRYELDSTEITNPFNISGNTKMLKSFSERVFMSRSDFVMHRLGACAPSYIAFQQAELINGSFLSYDDSIFIKSNQLVSIKYAYTGKFKYSGSIQSESGATVTLRMPDLQDGYLMKCMQGETEIPSTHAYVSGNDSVQLIIINFPSGGIDFTLELADPCQADCFFPPTNEPIDTLYVFDTGSKETLGHDLDIIQPSGELQITNGSKMSICSDFVFTNKDILKLFALDAENSTIYENPMDGIGTISTPVRDRIATKRSMIIVNNKAALVLDSGSFTHVGDNSTILVLKGGTLLIRKGAIVEIGGNEVKSPKAFGEIIAEEGAYVCIEDSSDIYVFADTPTVDTTDNNVFFVRLTGSLPTVAGTNPDAGMGKFTYNPVTKVTGIYANSNCIPFCDLKTYRPLHGVNNRDFGWCNFSTPVARLVFPTLTCANVPILLKEYTVLNETYYKLDIYNSQGLFYTRQSTTDSPRFNTLMLPSLREAGSYSINFDVSNDCAETDNLSKTISIAPKPVAAFTASATGCEGMGTITANGSVSGAPTTLVKHLWFVQRLDSVYQDTLGGILPDDYTQEWARDTLTEVDSNFTFPGFYWKGGYRYLVGLTVYGVCSDSTVMDTVHIPLGVDILRDSLKIYPNVPSYASIQIKTKGNGYSSFSWSPTTGLTNSNTLNPTASPTVTTKYTLTAVNGSCTVKDSVVVKVIDCAIAGYDKTICKGDTTFIGYVPMGCEPNSTCYNSVYYCMPQMLWKEDSTLANVNALGTSVWPSVTTTYTIYALMEQFNGGDEPPPTPIYDTVEFDQITVYVDTLPGTFYGINYQADSTVYFSNYTQAINGATYLWIFGDGDSSTAINPIHTFPAFDTSYVVCLQATNACGMRQSCDTVWVDSNSLSLYSFGKRGNDTGNPTWLDDTRPNETPVKLSNKNMLGNNRPNPFDKTTEIDYELVQNHTSARLVVTNILGQTIQDIMLPSIQGTVVISMDNINSGVYYYALVVDGLVVSHKMMMLR